MRTQSAVLSASRDSISLDTCCSVASPLEREGPLVSQVQQDHAACGERWNGSYIYI